MEKIVLAYSGGLDTTVAIRWMKENYGCDVIAVAIVLYLLLYQKLLEIFLSY